MKKMIMTLAIALSSLAVFAGEENVSQKVLDAFKNEFSIAQQVEWTVGDSYYKAAFVYNNQHVFAFYDMDGELIGLTRYMSSVDLPINLQLSMKKGNGYWISDLFEVAKNESTTYYVTLETADTKIVLKSADGNSWENYQKTKKI